MWEFKKSQYKYRIVITSNWEVGEEGGLGRLDLTSTHCVHVCRYHMELH
jgi:hypothetical protein